MANLFTHLSISLDSRVYLLQLPNCLERTRSKSQPGWYFFVQKRAMLQTPALHSQNHKPAQVKERRCVCRHHRIQEGRRRTNHICQQAPGSTHELQDSQATGTDHWSGRARSSWNHSSGCNSPHWGSCGRGFRSLIYSPISIFQWKNWKTPRTIYFF